LATLGARKGGIMLLNDPQLQARYLAPTAINLFFPPAKGDYKYFEMRPYGQGEPERVEAARAADASMLAYARFVSTRMTLSDYEEILGNANYGGVRTIGDCFAANAQTARGFFAKNEAAGHALLAFRGTEADDQNDKDADLDAILVPENGALVHQGFKRYLDAVWDDVAAAVATYRRDHPNQLITVTGHSLGAALASLAFTRLNDPHTSLFTFGCPRVGNWVFCRRIEDASVKQRCYRVVDDLDVVTHVPPLPFYAHPGISLMWLSDKHLLIENPQHPPDDWLDAIKLVPGFATSHWFDQLPDPLPDPLADHSPVRYCQWMGMAV
jgi:hypothetical protein